MFYQIIDLGDSETDEIPPQSINSVINIHTTLFGLMAIGMDIATSDEDRELFAKAFKGLSDHTINYNHIESMHFDLNLPLDTEYDDIKFYAEMLNIFTEKNL